MSAEKRVMVDVSPTDIRLSDKIDKLSVAHIEINPRGCKGKTHVSLQNGPVQCYDNVGTATVSRLAAELSPMRDVEIGTD